MVDFQDEVKHITGDAVGTVIAMYTIDNIEYIDVRISDYTLGKGIYYKTPKANWETTVPVDE